MKKKRKNARTIGAVAERKCRDLLNCLFAMNWRRSQQRIGAPDAADLIDDNAPDLAPECKRSTEFSIKLHRAVQKARADAADGATAFVLHGMPRERWLLTVDLLEAPILIAKIARRLGEWGGCDGCQGSGQVAGRRGSKDCERCEGSGLDLDGDVASFLSDILGNAEDFSAQAETIK